MKKAYCLVAFLFLAGALLPAQAQDETPPPPAAQGQGAPPAAARPAQRPPGMFMAAPLPHGVVKDYKPVTDEMLLNPPPGDWLQYQPHLRRLAL